MEEGYIHNDNSHNNNDKRSFLSSLYSHPVSHNAELTVCEPALSYSQTLPHGSENVSDFLHPILKDRLVKM